MHEEFMAFVSDEGSYRAARALAEARGWPQATVQQGGLEMLADMLESHAPPRLLLLDIDGEKDVLASAARAVSLCGPDCRIILTAKHNDISLYRQFIKLGAADYLVKPLADDQLLQASQNAMQPAMAKAAVDKELRGSKIIPLIGTRGGVGVTTLAVNLGWIMAQTLEQHVALLDLDMQFGTTALALDKEPGRGMKDALENPERLDGLLVASSMVQVAPKLSVLCAEEPLETPVHMDGDATLSLIKPVRGDFDYILVDLPRHFLSMQKRLLSEAHTVVIVTDLTLSSLRDARRIRQMLKLLRPDVLPVIVANHGGETAAVTIDQATFEKNLEAKIDFAIPEDIKTARLAANTGKAFAAVAPDVAATKAITLLARTLTGMKETKKAKAGQGVGAMLKGIIPTKPPKPVTES